jgi:hypothetical protein
MQSRRLGGAGSLAVLLCLLAGTAAHAQRASLSRVHAAVVHHNATTEQEPLVTGPIVSDLGHGLHVISTAWVTPTAISIQTNAWRTRGSAVAHGFVGVSLIDGAGHVIAASGLHRFHTGSRRMWGSSTRSYRWTDPVPFDLGSKTASVVIHHTRTLAGLERRVTGPPRNGLTAVHPPAERCDCPVPGRPCTAGCCPRSRSSQA